MTTPDFMKGKDKEYQNKRKNATCRGCGKENKVFDIRYQGLYCCSECREKNR